MKLPEGFRITQVGRTLMFAVGGGLFGWFMGKIASVNAVPWILAIAAWAVAWRIVLLAGEMRRVLFEIHDIIAHLAESYIPAAEAYDQYAEQHATAPMPNGATQIVHAIAASIRDLGTADNSDQFDRKLDFRRGQLPHFEQ